MPRAGHSTTLKVAVTSTAMVAEACANIDGGVYKKYRVTNTARRIIDIDTALTVKKNGVAVAVTAYTLNPLFGTITFDAALIITDVVTIDANYLSTVSVAEVRDVSFSLARTMLDKTSFDSGGVRQRLAGLKDCNGSWEQLERIDAEIIPGATLEDAWESGHELILEVVFGSAAGETFRAAIIVEGLESKAAVDDLVTGNVTWQARDYESPATAGLRINSHFGFDDWT